MLYEKGYKFPKDIVEKRTSTRRKNGWFKNLNEFKKKISENTASRRIEVREKMSKAKKGKNYDIRYGPKKAQEVRNNISKSLKNHPHYKNGKSMAKMLEFNRSKNGRTYEEIYGKEKAQQIKQKMSESKIGPKNNRYGIKLSNEVKKKMQLNNLGKKRSEEARKHISLAHIGSIPWNKELPPDQQPNWQGGKSFEPYTLDFNDEFKELIRKRDGHICQLCEITQADSERKLAVHHIDYNKLNSFQQNCTSLCIKCHILTNYNRDEWKTFFQSLLKRKYGYEYTPDQKIVLDFNKPIEVLSS